MERLADAGFARLQALGRRHARRTSASSTPSRRSPTATARSCGSRGCGRRAAAPTSGTSCTRPRRSSAQLYDWLLAHGEEVLTGDSFFHLAAYGDPLPGLNLCGAGRVVCLIDPVGDVYACPFAIHDAFLAGNVREPRRLRRACGASPSCSRSCAGRRRAARACRARTTTPAAAAAWRRSSSPACRSTAPTRSACSATASRCSTLLGDREPSRRPAVDHSRRGRRGPTGRATRARSPGWSPRHERHADGQRLVRDRSPRRSGARKQPPARVGLHGALVAGSEFGLDARGQRRGVRRARVRAARRRPAGERDLATTVMGQAIVAAGDDLADRRAGGAPRRRGRGRARGGRARHGDGAELVREQAGRGGRRGQPADVLPDVLVGHARADPAARRSARRRRARRADRHARLVVLARPRLGQPGDPGAARPQDDGQVRARGARAAAVARSSWAQTGGPPDLTVPNMAAPGEPRADVLRRLRRVDADAAADLGRPALAARAVGRAVHAQGRHARRRRAPAPSTSASTRSRSPTTAATTSTARRRRSARCRRSPTRSATRSRSLLDGGIRRGSDVVKALALGARAVMIGRAYLWGLAANGQAGVENVLDILRSGIDSALLGLGKPSVRDLGPADLLVPDGFARRLGVPDELVTAVRPGEARLAAPGPTLDARRAARARRPARAPPSSTARTCRWRPTPTSPARSRTRPPPAAPTSSRRPRCRTAPAASTPASPARCRSASTALERGGRRARPQRGRASRRVVLVVVARRQRRAAGARRRRACATKGAASRAGSRRHAGGDAHAGRTETSLMLALAPELRRRGRAAGRRRPAARRAAARAARARRARRHRPTACSATPAAPRRRRAARCCATSRRTSARSSTPRGRHPSPRMSGAARAARRPRGLPRAVGPGDGRTAGSLTGGSPFRMLRVTARRRRSDRGLAAARADRRPGRLPRARPPAARRRHARPAARAAATSTAELTVVVPVRDRPAQLERCLDAVRAGCPDSPVVVVDDGSADPAAVARGLRPPAVRAWSATPVSRGAGRGAQRRPRGVRDRRTSASWTPTSCCRRRRRRDCSGTSRIRASPPSRRASARLQPGGGLIGGYEERHSALDMGPARRPGRSRPADALRAEHRAVRPPRRRWAVGSTSR